MKPQRILLPIDTAQCPMEVFAAVNGFACRPEVTVILLHVVNLNIVAPENRVYEELGREVYSHLCRLADKYIHPFASTAVRVRAGHPEEEILAEAAEQKADLIILPNWGPSLWARLTSSWKHQPGLERPSGLPRARHRMDHPRQRSGFTRVLLPGHFRCLPRPLRPLFPALSESGANGVEQIARYRRGFSPRLQR
jgi:nucleotide-binding universal stress UspA family protein